ncbi:hypothetical protein Nepgr_013171 [Nepenthes gracilis]|uniref:Uncharacterized protein n=1 Tax=Nepenthes gracilis TaxID=150966 RepID=A0AAD3SGZ8_NEPGR|nr:hypothetical protein Nepgr_013171 [Nepenthes gracilis]
MRRGEGERMAAAALVVREKGGRSVIGGGGDARGRENSERKWRSGDVLGCGRLVVPGDGEKQNDDKNHGEDSKAMDLSPFLSSSLVSLWFRGTPSM